MGFSMQTASPAVLTAKVVLVVDAPHSSAILVDELQGIGARVVGPVTDAHAVLALLDRAGRVDVAVVDVDVLGPDLLGLVTTLRRRGVPVLLASQGGCAAAQVACGAPTASGKPVDLGTVAAAFWLGP